MDFITKILERRSNDVTILANEKFRFRAEQIKRRFPSVQIVLKPDTHAKMVLIEPDTVWLSSENFGRSGWFEQAIGIHNADVYDFYYSKVLDYIWS